MNSRKKRVIDFEERARARPRDVCDLGELGCYVAIHPMSDETALLKRLKLSPDDCIGVDLYWKYQGDVRFVQVHGQGSLPLRPVGLYARLNTNGYINIEAVEPEKTVSSADVERLLRSITKIKLTDLDDELKPVG